MRPVPASSSVAALVGLLILPGLGCGPDGQVSEAPAVQIDHVIVAIGDLQAGMDLFEEMTGVRPIFGGEHPGRGTRNALVSLGPQMYLELLALQEGVEAIDEAPGLMELDALTPWGWAASTTDLDSTLARLQAAGFGVVDPVAGSRATPDGGLLKWSTGGVEDPVILGAPFFIEWGEESPHPSTTSPPGCSLEGLTVMTPSAEELRNLAQLLGLAFEVVAVADAVENYELTLRCPAGLVTFTASIP